MSVRFPNQRGGRMRRLSIVLIRLAIHSLSMRKCNESVYCGDGLLICCSAQAEDEVVPNFT